MRSWKARLYRSGAFVALPLVIAVVVGTSASQGCVDPVVDDEIAALGDNGGRNGPDHRPGEPCLLCHDGGKANAFSVAGTVFSLTDEKIGIENATVTITDASGRKLQEVTNCAGNFYVEEETAPLAFPLLVQVDCPFPDGSTRRSVMGTRVNRDGSCAGCHTGSPSASSPGRVACAIAEPTPPFTASVCQGDGR